MSVKVEGKRIVLAERCGVEEAETLLAALLEDRERTVVITAEAVHTALWQVLIALGPRIEGRPADEFVLRHVLPAMPGTRAPEKHSFKE